MNGRPTRVKVRVMTSSTQFSLDYPSLMRKYFEQRNKHRKEKRGEKAVKHRVTLD
jgi:hypothetical protein